MSPNNGAAAGSPATLPAFRSLWPGNDCSPRLSLGIRLKIPSQGPAGGFVYERKQNRKGEEIGGLVPRITLKSIANNEEPEMVTLVDRPEINNKITRVCGPFTVEATIQAALTLAEEDDQAAGASKGTAKPPRLSRPDDRGAAAKQDAAAAGQC